MQSEDAKCRGKNGVGWDRGEERSERKKERKKESDNLRETDHFTERTATPTVFFLLLLHTWE